MTKIIQSVNRPRYEREDHRVEVARKKRLAMHTRLVQATMQAFSRHLPGGPSIELVIQIAEVSRGTFYKHFDSLDQALAAVGVWLTEQESMSISPLLEALDAPLQRACVGTRLFMKRAWEDPIWAGFVQRPRDNVRDSGIYKLIYQGMSDGMESGDFRQGDLDAITDLIMGVDLAAIRTITDYPPVDMDRHIDAVTMCILGALGVPESTAVSAIDFSKQYLLNLAQEWPVDTD